jgi:glutamine amidotransferase
MGWCSTSISADHPLLQHIEDKSYFYYLHSYALPVSDNTLATAYHADEFSAIIGHRNFIATQFHPERSSTAGARLLRNFVGLAA